MSAPADLHFLRIEPLDVLLLRGNQSFGDPGSYGDVVMPPWPSVAAGAIRSRMLADVGADLAAFARSEQPHPALGTPARPGPFTLRALHVARLPDSSKTPQERIDLLMPPPADLVINEEDKQKGKQVSQVLALTPTALPSTLASSCPLPQAPVLAQSTRGKPASGWWLTQAGWRKYLRGQTPDPADCVRTGSLWQFDERVGVGLSPETRSAADGRLFTTRAIAMQKGVGLVAAISGLAGAQPPESGLLRLGGDGRAACIQRIDPAYIDWPLPDWDAISKQNRCRLVLTSPGLFTQGWLPNGFTEQGDGIWRFNLHGVQGRLAAAAVARNETISGWDLARWQPKPAQRVAPTGSVYWLDELKASPDALRQLAERGLWSASCEDETRRAEGFNRVQIAAWPA